MFKYLIHSELQIIMNYNLNIRKELSSNEKVSTANTLKRLMTLMGNERKNLYFAMIFIFINSGLNLVGPYLIGHAVDTFVQTKQYDGVIKYSIILFSVFCLALVSGYTQAQLMGRVGQRMLFNLRNTVFNKLQELPIDFFNQNKAGDLISRVNNDTDKINQFFSQSLVQFMSSIFTMTGAVIFLLSINIFCCFSVKLALIINSGNTVYLSKLLRSKYKSNLINLVKFVFLKTILNSLTSPFLCFLVFFL